MLEALSFLRISLASQKLGRSAFLTRLDSNIESKSLNNTYLNIIEIFNKLFKKLNIIESQNLVVTSTKAK